MSLAEKFLLDFAKWLKTSKLVDSSLLVGSYARGEQSNESDIDLVILSLDPTTLIDKTEWISNFGKYTKVEVEFYGPITSLRAFFENGLEVEFGIGHIEWANTEPIDHGTARVISDGAQILFDPIGRLGNLIEKVKSVPDAKKLIRPF